MRLRAVALVLLALASAAPSARTEDEPPLVLEHRIPLPGVQGRIDHLALDEGRGVLAVAALANDTVEIVDLQAGRVAHRIADVGEPQGVVFLRDGRLAVTSGADGSVRLYRPGTWAPAGRVETGGDADNIRLEPDTGRVLVGHGNGAIAVLDGDRKVADLPLPSHPESFQVEAGGPRVFANVPGAQAVVVLDRVERRTLATWRLGGAASNFPMALDEANARLLVGCRRPSRLVVLDTTDGHVVHTVDIAGDVDDVWIDPPTGRVLLSCGEGVVEVLEPAAQGPWRRVARVATRPGARTSLLDADRRRLYVAAPRRGEEEAEVRVYAVRGR